MEPFTDVEMRKHMVAVACMVVRDLLLAAQNALTADLYRLIEESRVATDALNKLPKELYQLLEESLVATDALDALPEELYRRIARSLGATAALGEALNRLYDYYQENATRLDADNSIKRGALWYALWTLYCLMPGNIAKTWEKKRPHAVIQRFAWEEPR